jgi:hypothetical protein
VLLLLKVIIVPALVVFVTLGGRRWGPRIGGFLTSFPIVAGPTLFFFATEQCGGFARDAARATLVALVGVAISGLIYAWTSLRLPWWASLAASWAGFVVTTLGINALSWSLPLALAAAVGSFFLVRALLPTSHGAPVARARSAWDLPLRVLTSVTVVLVLTGLADWLGPTRSGAFTAFPAALAILLVFTHVQQGRPSVIRFLHGFLPGMWSFALFCFVVALAVVPLGKWLAFTLAILSLVLSQVLVLRRVSREQRVRPL